MTGPVIEFSDLQRISAYTRRADVERWAQRQGIAYKYSRSGIWTTLDAMNAALGITPAANDAAPYDAESLIQ